MHHKLLYLAIFTFLAATATTATENTTDETAAIQSNTEEATTTENTTDETATTQSSTEKTTETESTTTAPPTTVQNKTPLHVYFVNDLHYHILPLDAELQPCTASEKCFGGLARLKKMLDSRGEIPPLLINAGHSLDGELFNAFGLSAFKIAANHLNFSAQAPSEELYSFGLDLADTYILSEHSNIVCANVEPKQSPKLLESDDCSISVIGFVEKDRIDSLKLVGLTAEEEKAAVEAEVKKAEGDIIIVVGSSSLEKAKEIAAIEKVDVVLVSGAEIKSTNGFFEKVGDGAYVASLYVNDTSLKYIFNVGELTFNLEAEEKCKVKSVEMNNFTYNESEEDEKLKSAMAPFLERLTVVTNSDAVVNCSDDACLRSECAAGSLVADAVVLRSALHPTNPKLALVPGHVFSQLIIKNEVKGSDLYRMLDNFYLSSIEVNGSILKKVFETSVADYKDNKTPMTNYLQISAFFRVTYDLNNGEGHRVHQLQVFSSDSGEWKFEDVSEDKNYTVVVPADLRETTQAFDFVPNGTLLNIIGEAETMLDALVYYTNATGNHLLVPPLGVRIQYKQGTDNHHNDCYNNTGEVIILTLVVAGLLSGLGLFVWKYIYPRYRVRRGSTIHLIS